MSVVWSVFDRVEQGLPRTNNSLEGWHGALQKSMGYHYPTIYKLIETLKLEQSYTENRIARLNAGHRENVKKTKYVLANKAIATLVGDYQNRQP